MTATRNRRAVVGPRGGKGTARVSCPSCVSFNLCRPSPLSALFGCESWVDSEGRRVDTENREGEEEYV